MVRSEVRMFSVKNWSLLSLRDVLNLFGFVFFLYGSLIPLLSKYVKCFFALDQELGASLRLQVKTFVLNIKFLKFSNALLCYNLQNGQSSEIASYGDLATANNSASPGVPVPILASYTIILGNHQCKNYVYALEY
jgi:hypothetical protein